MGSCCFDSLKWACGTLKNNMWNGRWLVFLKGYLVVIQGLHDRFRNEHVKPSLNGIHGNVKMGIIRCKNDAAVTWVKKHNRKSTFQEGGGGRLWWEGMRLLTPLKGIDCSFVRSRIRFSIFRERFEIDIHILSSGHERSAVIFGSNGANRIEKMQQRIEWKSNTHTHSGTTSYLSAMTDFKCWRIRGNFFPFTPQSPIRCTMPRRLQNKGDQRNGFFSYHTHIR